MKYWETARCNGGIVWLGWERYFVLCLLNYGCVILSNIVTHDNDSSFFLGSASRGLLQCQIPLLQTANSINALLEIIILAREFNRHLKSRVEEDADQLYNDLETYRHTHLELCGLVDEANKLFRFFLACEVTLYSVGLLLLLYTVSIGLTEDGGLRGLLSFWCALLSLIAAMLVFLCHDIKEKVCYNLE